MIQWCEIVIRIHDFHINETLLVAITVYELL